MVNVHELSSIYVSLIWLDYVGLLKILVFVGSICWCLLMIVMIGLIFVGLCWFLEIFEVDCCSVYGILPQLKGQIP